MIKDNLLAAIFQLTDGSLLTILFMIMGGLGTFLFGLNLMSSSLKGLAGNRLRAIISKATDKIWKGFLTGLVLTVLIQSSSATTVIVVGLIAAGLIDLKQALPIMIGAHIGTTVTAYIIGANIGVIAFPLIFIGSFIILFVMKKKWNLSGKVFIGVGFLFLGLEMMSVSFGSVAEKDWFRETMVLFSNNWILGFLSGLFMTVLIQSSSAFIGITQELYIAGNSMGLEVALTLVIGSNIGTTITALIASLSGNKVSKQAAFSNMLISVFGAILFLPFLIPLTNLFNLLETRLFGDTNMFTIAFFHTFYNIVVSLVSLALIPVFIKITKLIIKDTGSKNSISAESLSVDLIKSPSLALENARLSIIDMNNLALEMTKVSIEYFNQNDHKLYDKIVDMEEKCDLFEHLIHDYLMMLSEESVTEKEGFLQTKYIDVIRDTERIGDHAMNFAEYLDRYYSENNVMSDEMHQALLLFFNIIVSQIEDANVAFEKDDKTKAYAVIEREKKIDVMEQEYRLNVHSYMKTGEVSQLDILFVDIVSNLERISDHCTNIAEMVIDPHMMSTLITGSNKKE